MNRRSLSHITVRASYVPVIRMLLALVIFCAISAVFASAAQTKTKLCYYCIHDIGLDVFYTHTQNTCRGQPIDPINVAWYDYTATSKIAPEVIGELVVHSNGAWFDTANTDPQGIRNLSFQCGNEAYDEGTGVPIAPERNHVRVFNTFTQTAWFAVGDAHHDSGVTCHGSSDFITPKRDIYQYFHQLKRYQFWGNTRSIYQSCINKSVASNGWTALMQASNN
jgi:hypothetical protein